MSTQHHHQSPRCRWQLRIPLLWLSIAVAPLSYSQVSFAQLVDEEVARLHSGAAAQAEVDRLDEQRAGLANQYRGVLKQQTNMRTYNQQLRDTVKSQEEEMASLRSQIGSVGQLERNVVPLMVDMLDTLEQFIELDTPFFLSERRDRVATLRKLMVREGIPNSERYRRILEAYQIENDYGRSLEAYEDNLSSIAAGADQAVTFLKLGRIALFYQTLDGKQAYLYRRDKTLGSDGYWQPLSARQNVQLTLAIKMAREQIPSNLIRLPVVLSVAGPAQIRQE